MPFNFSTLLAELKQNGFTSNEIDNSLERALEFLSDNLRQLCTLPGTTRDKIIEGFIVTTLVAIEDKINGKNKWRFAIDFAVDNDGKYLSPITIQFCSGAPSYSRCVIAFGQTQDITTNLSSEDVLSRIEASCVEDNPNLNDIMAGTSEEQRKRAPTISMEQVKQFYDKVGMQRIAILGSARVQPYDSNLDEKTRKWSIKYTSHAQKNLDAFLTQMEKFAQQKIPYSMYALVNGGWAGIHEDGMGMPMMAHLYGIVHSNEQKGFYNPITVIPSQGTFDRVKTLADSLNTTQTVTVEECATAKATYFEVSGTWGDDSKYLVGISTSLVIFDPHGAWTNIEIANGIAQGKPVVIIADPAKLVEGEYGDLHQVSKTFWERDDGVRVYKDVTLAAIWLTSQWTQKQVAMQSPQQPRDVYGKTSQELHRQPPRQLRSKETIERVLSWQEAIDGSRAAGLTNKTPGGRRHIHQPSSPNIQKP